MEDLNIISEYTVEIRVTVTIPFGPGIFRVPAGRHGLLMSERPITSPSTTSTRAMSECAAMISCNIYCVGENGG
jgi:hypothetical protein